MAQPDQEHVACPGCGKRYRWQGALAGREIPCKQCGAAFIIPDRPGPGLTAPTAEPEDDGLYDLASDPDEERELPPAYTPLPTAAQTSEPPAPAVTNEPAMAGGAAPERDADQAGTDREEEEAYVSEAAKATRREEQRIAAAANQDQTPWWKQKWVYILLALALLVVCLIWAVNRFAEFMEDPTKPQTPEPNAMQQAPPNARTTPAKHA